METETYRIYSTSHNGPGGCRSQTICAKNLTGAKRIATREAAGDRCHISITDMRDNILATRWAVDNLRGCCVNGWLPWK